MVLWDTTPKFDTTMSEATYVDLTASAKALQADTSGRDGPTLTAGEREKGLNHQKLPKSTPAATTTPPAATLAGRRMQSTLAAASESKQEFSDRMTTDLTQYLANNSEEWRRLRTLKLTTGLSPNLVSRYLNDAPSR